MSCKRKMENRICDECGKSFSTRTYSPAKCCSQSCCRKGFRNHQFIDGRSKDSSLKQRLQWKAHPERMLARQITRQLVRRKKLIRKPCEQCGDIKSEAHHEDYSKPTEVKWLCRKHHIEKHLGMDKQALAETEAEP